MIKAKKAFFINDFSPKRNDQKNLDHSKKQRKITNQ